MAFFNKRKSLIGLDIGSECIKALEISADKGDYVITGYGQIDVSSEDARPDAITDLLHTCSFKSKKVVSAVSGRSLIVRFLNIVEMPEDNLNNAIRYEADKYIPFQVDEVVLDSAILPDFDDSGTDGETSEMRVLLVAVKQNLIDEHLQLLNGLGLTEG